MINKKTIPIFVPHSGCPNDCVFCNQKKITGVSSPVGPDEARNIIENAIATIPKDSAIEIAFFGGSFTAIEEINQKELLQVALDYKQKINIIDIRISTRPDSIDQRILDYLKEYGVSIIELGVQSLDEEVLKLSNRGHNSECVYESSKLILKNGFKLGLQMMAGLPGDTPQKVDFTAKEFVKIKPNFVRIYPVLVIKDTELESLFESKVYKPWSIEETVDVCSKVYKLFAKNKIKVIRIGLQATEEINENCDVVAGPFHPAMGELVYSRVLRDVIEEYIKNHKIENKKIEIQSPDNLISKIVGNKKSNKEYFKIKYKVEFKIQRNNDIVNIIIDKSELNLEELF